MSGGSLSARAIVEAAPALICAVGPSRPPEPPDPIVIADATSLMSTTRGRMLVGLWWIAEIAASVPCPSASGAKVNTSNPATRPPRPTTSGMAHGRAKSDAGDPVPSPIVVAGVYPPRSTRSSWVQTPRAHLNASAPRPATIPTSNDKPSNRASPP